MLSLHRCVHCIYILPSYLLNRRNTRRVLCHYQHLTTKYNFTITNSELTLRTVFVPHRRFHWCPQLQVSLVNVQRPPQEAHLQWVECLRTAFLCLKFDFFSLFHTVGETQSQKSKTLHFTCMRSQNIPWQICVIVPNVWRKCMSTTTTGGFFFFWGFEQWSSLYN